MNTDEIIAKIERDIKESQKIAEMGAAVERLRKNKDFQKVVVAGYLEQEAVRLVHLKSAASMQHPDKQASILRDIDGIGSFVQYLENILTFAGRAQDSIHESEEALVELRNEEQEVSND